MVSKWNVVLLLINNSWTHTHSHAASVQSHGLDIDAHQHAELQLWLVHKRFGWACLCAGVRSRQDWLRIKQYQRVHKFIFINNYYRNLRCQKKNDTDTDTLSWIAPGKRYTLCVNWPGFKGLNVRWQLKHNQVKKIPTSWTWILNLIWIICRLHIYTKYYSNLLWACKYRKASSKPCLHILLIIAGSGGKSALDKRYRLLGVICILVLESVTWR